MPTIVFQVRIPQNLVELHVSQLSRVRFCNDIMHDGCQALHFTCTEPRLFAPPERRAIVPLGTVSAPRSLPSSFFCEPPVTENKATSGLIRSGCMNGQCAGIPYRGRSVNLAETCSSRSEKALRCHSENGARRLFRIRRAPVRAAVHFECGLCSKPMPVVAGT